MQKRGEEKRRFGCLQHFVFKDNWFISNLIMLFTFWREYFGSSFYIHTFIYIFCDQDVLANFYNNKQHFNVGYRIIILWIV